MPKKRAAKQQTAPISALDEAIAVKAMVKSRLDRCDPKDVAKYVDAYSRAANVVRQFEKDRRRTLASFTDDELIEYIQTLPERRRDALLIAVQGKSMAGKALF